MRVVAFLVLMIGCSGKDPTPATQNPTTPQTSVTPEDCSDGLDNDGNGLVDCDDGQCDTTCDADADGHDGIAFGGDDCDDADDDVNPDAPEICDDLDNDCDGAIDDDDPDVDASGSPWYPDRDADGFGDGSNVSYQCDPPAGGPAAQVDGDCDDDDAAVFPGAFEVCNNIDDNCDGLVDDDDPLVDLSGAPVWYEDADGDGLGHPYVSIQACARPPGYAASVDDCDDTDPTIGGPFDWWLDADGDGFGSGAPVASCTPPATGWIDINGSDCNDGDASIHPGAYETCGDGIDSDCDTNDCAGVCTEIRVGLLEGWGTGSGDSSLEWQGLLANQASYGSCPITVIDFNMPFSQAAFEAANITVLWSGDPAGGTTQYAPTDIAEIDAWLQAGNGGIVTTYLWYYLGYDDREVSGFAGLDAGALIDGNISAMTNIDVLDPLHPLAANLPLNFDPSSYAYTQATTVGLMSALLPSTTVVMASTDDTNLVVAYEPGLYRGVLMTTFVEYQASNPTDTQQLMYNAAYWASGY